MVFNLTVRLYFAELQPPANGITVSQKGANAMSTADEQNKKRTVTGQATAEKRRQEDTGREGPTQPNEVGSAKKTTTVRGRNEPQSVRSKSMRRSA
jgi:hypothetical protein